MTGTVTCRLKNVTELTAAGQLQIYTVFPFNSGCKAGNQKQRKCSKKSGERNSSAYLKLWFYSKTNVGDTSETAVPLSAVAPIEKSGAAATTGFNNLGLYLKTMKHIGSNSLPMWI